MDITTATPAAIDAELARIGAQLADQHRILTEAMGRQAKQRAGQIYPGTYDEVELRRTISRAADKMADLQVERHPLDREFDQRGGWTRYYLVDSYDGHVHRDCSWSRCSRTSSTVHVWLTDYSGMPEEELVELAGERACTVCFPDAPVEVLRRRSVFTPPSAVEREARRLEREKARLARQEKALTRADGGPVRIVVGGYAETVKTARRAELRAVEIEVDAAYQGRAMTVEEQEAVGVILAALARKRGTTVEVERAAHDKRVAAKRKREGLS